MPGSEYVIKYVSDFTDATSGARKVEQINADMAKTISGDFQKATRVLGTSLNKVSETPIKLKGGQEAIKTVSQLGTVVQTSNGEFKEFTKSQTFINGQLTKTSGSLKDVTGQFARTNIETEKGKKNFLTLGENIGRLAKRALITIPVWLALRGAIMGTFKTIRDGLKTIEEQDRAWQKAKRTLQGSTSAITGNFDKLREATTKLSIDTGESIEKITNAFYKFSTVGFDFETSMKGAEFAVKSAIVQFGDAEETANAFARAMRVLVDTSEGAKSAGEQIAEAMALTTELWKSNAFELNEFTASLEKFAGTAKGTNFTTQQTVALLASLSTAGIRGSRGGRLLRTSILKLLNNLDKLGSTLGVTVNPQLDSTFDVLMKVLGAIQGLDEGSKVAKDTAKVLGTLFGGAKGSELILALKAIDTQLKQNLRAVGDVGKLDKEFEDVNQTTSRLVTRIKNLNKEIGKAFVVGLVGGEDYNKLLKSVISGQERLADSADNLARALKNALIAGGVTSAIAFRAQILSLITLIGSKLIPLLTSTVGLGGIAIFTSLNLIDTINRLDREADKSAIQLAEIGQKIGERINKGLTNQLDATSLRDLIIELETFGASGLGIDETVLQKSLERLKKIKTETQEIERIQGKKTKIAISDQQDVAKLILDIELDRLRALGATNSELLKAEDLYTRQLDIDENSLDKIKRRLELEKSINEEKRVQNRLGSDSIKLFEIAQTEGEEMARKVSEALADKETFQRVLRIGGETAELLRKEFADKVQQVEAEQFFRGERVARVPELRGGTGVNIEEEAIRGIGVNISRAITENLKAQREFQGLEGGEVKIVRPGKIEIIGWHGEGNVPGAVSNEEINRRINIENVARRVAPGAITERNIPNVENQIDINFSEGTFTIIGQTKEEQLKEINKAFINLGTPGTKENQQLNKGLTGNKQNQVL